MPIPSYIKKKYNPELRYPGIFFEPAGDTLFL